MTAHTARSFLPVTTPLAHTLILGSMPGIKSLEAGQYYAHPQNAFWKIMGKVFDAPVDTYKARDALIKENGLALWDVLKQCERRGSLDSSIDPQSVEVNDFAAFFRRHKDIERVFFNGAKAETEFCGRVLPLLTEEVVARLSLLRLPSTSPAHAGMCFEEKLSAWRVILQAKR